MKKMNTDRRQPPMSISKQEPVDIAAALGVLAFAALISLFAIRNYDIWWMLGVARRIVETKSFITEDPFTFTVGGAPWAPQAYLSALVFYAVHSMSSAWGLVAVRAILVVAIFAVSFKILARAGVRWALASPVVLVVLLNAHSRFLVRAHLFEYLFLVLLVGFLLTASTRKNKSFFVFPLVLQVLWVNMHPSFLLGPVLTVVFFAGEWLSGVLSKRGAFLRPYAADGYDWRRVGLLVLLLFAACLVNPSPSQFLTQPFGSEQRELISQFTLEWRSPFDPALKAGAFHPYYEIFLGLAALSIVLAIRRLPLAPALLIVATAYLSFQAHRFRVEFALVSLPMVFLLFRSSGLVESIRRRFRRARYAPAAAGLVVSAILIVTAADRVSISEAVADRYPDKAYEFVKKEGIARRPFHTIGYGSYLVWDLYGERKSFIDGRNFSPALYRDFLACQMNDKGRRNVVARYDLDAFVIPSIELSDAGMERIHRSLMGDDAWTLCYLDEHAWIYVRDDAVDAGWLKANGYGVYHPLTLHNRRMRESDMHTARAELERAVVMSPGYLRIRVDLALTCLALGDRERAAREIERALELDPQNTAALHVQTQLKTSN